MSLAPPVNAPPTGHGVYARGQSLDWLRRFDFVAVNADRRDAETMAGDLVSAGVEVWFYRMPSSWEPEADFAAAVARDDALVAATGAAGAIADVENGWRTARRGAATALSLAIGESVAAGKRWGVTSFPEGIHWCRTVAPSGAWFTPQLYDASGDPGWYARWTDAFGADRCIPSVGLWSARYPDAAAYRAYLATLPTARGAIGWTTNETEHEEWLTGSFLGWPLPPPALPPPP